MTNVISKNNKMLPRRNRASDLLIVNTTTLIMIDGENLSIHNDKDSIHVSDDQLAVITEPGEYVLDYAINCSIHVQELNGGSFNFSGNFVVNLADSRKAVSLLNKEVPLFVIADRLITMVPTKLDSSRIDQREALFTYRNVTLLANDNRYTTDDTANTQTVYDAMVIGAGPYGTSAAIALKNSQKSVYWAGEALSFWLRNIQPTPLRSVKAATNIYIGRPGYSFIDFCNKFDINLMGKIQFWEFLAYYFYLITEFEVFPSFEKVSNVYYADDIWHIDMVGIHGQKTIKVRNVVNATGIGMHPNVPAVIAKLPNKIAAHVSATAAQALPENKTIAVIGGAQSAIEYALQAECLNNSVTLYVRDSLIYRNLHEPKQIIYRYLATHCENIIGWLPERLKTKLLNYLLEGTCDPETRGDLEKSRIKVRENACINGSYLIHEDEAVLITDDGERAYDLVVAATGYHYDIHNIRYLASVINPDEHIIAKRYPRLNYYAMLKNAPRGLYFTGFACMYNIGFKAQFINGTNIVIKRIVNDIKRH